MKDNTIYNEADNMIYVKSENDQIFIICNDMSQVDSVQKKMHKHGNIMVYFDRYRIINDRIDKEPYLERYYIFLKDK